MIRHFVTTLLAAFAFNAFAAVDANQASRADLESVKGIGPGLSAKIVQARESGAFKGWGDLVERVGGIGAGSAAKLSQAGLTVAGAAYDGSAGAAASAARSSARSSAQSSAQSSARPHGAKAGKADRAAVPASR